MYCKQKIEQTERHVFSGVWINEKRFVFGSADKDVYVFKEDQKGIFHLDDRLKSEHTKTVRSVSCTMHEERQFIACGSFDSTVSVWREEAMGWLLIATLEGHTKEVKCVEWSPEEYAEKLLATCGRDSVIWIWLLFDDEFESVGLLNGHQQDVKCVRWLPGAVPVLFSCGYDNTVRIWREKDGEWIQTQVFDIFSETVWSLCFSPCRSFFACLSQGMVFLFQKKTAQDTWEKVKSVLCNERDAYSIDWSCVFEQDRSVSYIATGGDDNRICLLKFSNGKIEEPLYLSCKSAALSVSWSKHGCLLSCHETGLVTLWMPSF